MEKRQEIKVGTICTLTKNKRFVFRLACTNYKGFPMSDSCVYFPTTFNQQPVVMKDLTATVAYTPLFEPASEEQIEKYNEALRNFDVRR